MTAVRILVLGLFSLVWGACGSSSPSPDDGGNDGAPRCTDDTECNATFCDGVYRCSSGTCERVSNTCELGESCDEAGRRCVRVCSTTRDADEDGFDAVECGGNDCDDANPSRHPGSTEVCDVANEDEDCDPRTFGVRDADGDGFPDAACCNVDAAGDMRCGTDCDDTRADVRPGANDGCNGLDDDCDGSVDEAGAIATFYPDCDGDGYGAVGSEARSGCMPTEAPTVCAGAASATWAMQATDCDDTRASVSPGAAEVCDGLDNDCDPETFAFGEDDDDDGYADAACGGDDCDDTCPSCHPDVVDELCDGLDNDCDEDVDEGVDPRLLRTFYRDADADGVGSATTIRSCVAPPGYVADDGDCNDGEDRVGVCSAPLRCVRGLACGCEAVLLNNAQYLDLDSGRTWLPTDPYNGARDLLVNNGLLAQKFLQVTGTGRFYRRIDPSDFFSVDASYTATVLGTGEDPEPWTSSTVYVVDTGIYYYRLGFFVNESPVRFIYEPIGARPADFACQAL